jgi:transcriptional regulator with PAS, ATPase and Fis domain
MDNKAISTDLYTNQGAGSAQQFTVQQIKDALNASTDNVTEAAILLGCTRDTVYKYIQHYPEL